MGIQLIHLMEYAIKTVMLVITMTSMLSSAIHVLLGPIVAPLLIM